MEKALILMAKLHKNTIRMIIEVIRMPESAKNVRGCLFNREAGDPTVKTKL
jgi:hypothetical protein